MRRDAARSAERLVLSTLRSCPEGAAREEVDLRTLLPGLGIARRHVYSAVLALADEGLLEYVGAGPRVRLTEAGLAAGPGDPPLARGRRER